MMLYKKNFTLLIKQIFNYGKDDLLKHLKLSEKKNLDKRLIESS